MDNKKTGHTAEVLAYNPAAFAARVHVGNRAGNRAGIGPGIMLKNRSEIQWRELPKTASKFGAIEVTGAAGCFNAPWLNTA